MGTLAVVALLATVSTGVPTKRALVIGNGAYAGSAALANPVADTKAIADRLRQPPWSFRVTLRRNRTRRQLTRDVAAFAKTIQRGDVALVYFAGHGMEIEGRNRLLGVDFRASSARTAARRGWALDGLLRALDRRPAAARIVVVDAARAFPGAARWTRSARPAGDKSAGFMPITERWEGTILVFSSAPKNRALDGGKRHSPFARALLTALEQPPPDDLYRLFVRVRESVYEGTEGRQLPALLDHLAGSVALVRPSGGDFIPKWPDKGCPGRTAEGCYEEGDRYFFGRGVIKDLSRARTLYRQACRGGYAKACLDLGYLFDDALGGPRDVASARRFYARACHGGSAVGCNDLGVLYEKGDGVSKDLHRAHKLFEQACDGGNALGCTNLGFLYDSGLAVEPDAERAFNLYRRACRAGHARGCTNLGVLYRRGRGISEDVQRARWLYGKGCQGGDALGCTNLGYLYDEGVGVRQDRRRARALYRRACDAGSPLGCTNLGFLFQKGAGVRQDVQRARSLYVQGCSRGHALACSNLGLLYEQGLGVTPALPKANWLYERACDRDGAEGCYFRGVNFQEGIGGPADAKRARLYFERACKLGHEEACER